MALSSPLSFVTNSTNDGRTADDSQRIGRRPTGCQSAAIQQQLPQQPQQQHMGHGMLPGHYQDDVSYSC